MDDLYDDLENYNEVAVLQELKSENMELKLKVEEYTTAMDKLQNDFDLLSSEFKKLEYNYSSLLKTAKSEIERKTQIITNINMEKDMLIISALKNGNKSVLNIKKNLPVPYRNTQKNKWSEAVNKKQENNAKEMQDDRNKKCHLDSKRLQEHQTSSNDKVNVGSEITPKQKNDNKFTTNIDSCNYGNNYTKENIHHIDIAPISQTENIAQSIQSTPKDIKSRRKSIPATYIESERLTLNEKMEYSSIDALQQDSQWDKEYRKRRMYEDRHSSKASEISLDDKFLGYNEPSRDSYKGRIYKYYDSDKHRSRDKYDTSEKFKRYSSERYKKQSTDYYQRSHRTDFGRSRIQTSPPVDRFHYHSYKERQQENERIHFNENDKYKNSNERYLGKYKASYYEYEEPNKRQRTDYNSRPKENVRLHGKETENQELAETFERLQKQYTSCQSPDYICNDTTSEPTKVIRDTAETPLEDPRLVTSKYILINENGSECLSIVKGRDIELIPIDKEKWTLPNLVMPRALTYPPIEEKHIKELCMLRGQIQPKLSRESIESQAKLVNQEAVDLQVLLNKHLSKYEHTANECYEDINKTILTKKKIDNTEKPTEGCLDSYKIPKIIKCGQVSKSNIFETEKSLNVIEDIGIGEDTKNCELKSGNKINLANILIHDSISTNDVGNCYKTGVLQNGAEIHGDQRVLSTREIVEGDLELSDETSDNTELQKTIIESGLNKQNPSPESNKTLQVKPKNTSTQSMVLNSQLEQQEKNITSKSNTNYKDNIALTEIEKPCDKTEEHIESSKKQKSKKKIHKNKDSEHLDMIEKKMKSKKDKPKEVKPKFNDLFGDSNSLITPDDLGIPLTQAQKSSQLTDIYMPIFEDAQDATDLEESTNVKTSLIQKTKVIDKVNTEIENNMELSLKIGEISKVIPEVTNCDIKVPNKCEEALVHTIHDNSKLKNDNKESDIVTTIIISTGVQPNEMNSESLVNAEELLSQNTEQDQIYTTHQLQDVQIKALATSTPYKEVAPQVSLEIDSKLTKADHSDICVSSTNNPLAPPNEDLPDVRIFVKRRRRLVKPAK